MAEYDWTQVQIEMMDLAWEMVNTTKGISSQSREAIVKERAERFDQAYKAIFKTVKETE